MKWKDSWCLKRASSVAVVWNLKVVADAELNSEHSRVRFMFVIPSNKLIWWKYSDERQIQVFHHLMIKIFITCRNDICSQNMFFHLVNIVFKFFFYLSLHLFIPRVFCCSPSFVWWKENFRRSSFIKIFINFSKDGVFRLFDERIQYDVIPINSSSLSFLWTFFINAIKSDEKVSSFHLALRATWWLWSFDGLV